VGFVRDAGRQAVLAHVARHFKLLVMQGVFGDEAVSAYWSAKVGLNVPTGYGQPDAYDSANMRCFEILATGTPLVTTSEKYLDELGFSWSTNYLGYIDADNLITQLEHLLNNTKTLDIIGKTGANLAQERHTYEHRAKQVLEWLK